MPYFEKIEKLNPKDKEVHLFLYDIYRKQNKDDLAYQKALTLIKLGSKEKGYYDFLFTYLNNKKDYKSMIEVFEKGLKAFPEEISFREYLIVAYLNSGEEALAGDQMKEILKKRPDDIPLLLRLARLQEKQGKPKEALESYKRIIEISPGHEEAEEAYLRLRFEVLPDETVR
jgi:tetratricopeptide (TPR) repeat protein